MRGSNIKNIYAIDSKEYEKHQLSQEHRDYINMIRDLNKYNDLRNYILSTYGNDVTCVIKIYFLGQLMEVYNASNQLIESR